MSETTTTRGDGVATAFERALHAGDAGALMDGASELAAVLRADPLTPLTDPQYAFVLRAADSAFTAGRLPEAEALYDWLVEHRRGGHGARLRRAHIRILRKQPEAALRVLDELAADPEYGVNGDRLRSLALMDLGRYQAAADRLRSVVARAPDDVAFVRLLITALERSGDLEQLESLDRLISGLDEAQRSEVLLRARLAREDYAAIRLLYDDCPPSAQEAAAGAVAEVVSALVREGELEKAARFLDAVETPAVRSAKLATAALGALLARGDWVRAERWLGAAAGLLGADADPMLKLKQLQFLCFTLRLEEADTLLREWESSGAVPDSAGPLIASLYGALDHWDDVVELLARRVARSLPLETEVLLEAVGLAARRTRRYAEVLSLLEESLAQESAPEVADLRDRLCVELSVLESLGTAAPRHDATSVEIATPIYAHRAALFSKLLGAGTVSGRTPATRDPEPVANGGGSIVFCTDRRYLLGTCVGVSSLLEHNPWISQRNRVLIVCSADSNELAVDLLATLEKAYGARLTLVPAAAVLPTEPGLGLRTGWGCFTPGHALSEAAYYRLFAIRHLVDEGHGGRALYIDSDTCVGRGLQGLLSYDLGGRPLGARYELPLPSIEHAALRLGLDVATYFNSGVLLFDLDHPALRELLERSIEIAVRHPELLTFLDQCALNIAFERDVTPLEDGHNFYVRPKDEIDMRLRPVVWHYLTHSKPWDPLYVGRNNGEWLTELATLRDVVGPERLRQLCSIQFEPRGGTGLPPSLDAAA